MTVYSILIIVITLAYISAKILNVTAFIAKNKDRLLSKDPYPNAINKLGICVFLNVFKIGLFILGMFLLNDAIIDHNGPAIFMLILSFIFLIPIDIGLDW